MRVLRPLVLSLLLVLGGGITALSAQNREVSGKVLDANQQPLVGVAVLVDGTTKGVTTSENGTFKIQVPSGEAVLQVTCLGYLPQKVTVPSSRNSITIYLQEDAIMLDATVVIGYGTQKKVNLTGAVATVGSKELENRVTHSLGSMLQGSVAGLNITTSSGKPGSTPAINIRGVNSINSADPLVLIDGVVGDLNRVNPNDVESISVIKDASAAAVYGARTARRRCVTAAVSAGRRPRPRPTTRTAVTGRSIRSTSSGRPTPERTMSNTTITTCSSCWRA